MNHFAVKCKSKVKSNRKEGNKGHRKSVKQVNLKYDSESSDQGGQYDSSESVLSVSLQGEDVNSIDTVSKVSPYETRLFATFQVEGKLVKIQIDSGASCNVIPEKCVPEGTKIKEAVHKNLSMYNNDPMPVVGTCKLKLLNMKNKKKYSVQFVVVKGNNQVPLLGSRASQQMKLIKVLYENIDDKATETCENDVEVKQVVNADLPLVKEWVIKEYQDVFTGLGCMPGKVHLETDPNVTQVIIPPRRVPAAIKPKLKEEMKRLEDMNVIQKVEEPTDWVSSLVSITKPSGKLRVCIDPQQLNVALKREHYPLPIIDDILPSLNDVKVLSKADLKEGFLQCQLDEESSKLTTFQTPWGRYRYKRMRPFGISPAPELFQQRLDQNLEGLDGVHMIADDILITGKGKTEADACKDHDRNMTNLLKRCRERSIKLNRDKCEFKCEEIDFIGHVVTKHGLKADPKKIEAIVDMPKPTDIGGVQRFIGMAKYLSKILPDLSNMCEPIRRLTHKDAKWSWGKAQEEAFEAVKRSVSSTPVLKYFDPTKETEGQGDASERGIGFTLMPVTFSSRALTSAETRYSQIEKELPALIFGLERNHQFTYGRKITLWTDHKPLVSISRKPITTAPKDFKGYF